MHARKVLLDYDRHRSLAWKIHLGLLHGDDPIAWKEQTLARRASYATLRDELMIDPTKQQGAAKQDLALDNPLSVAEDSSWNKYFQDEEIVSEVNKDLQRLTPLEGNEQLFDDERVVSLMRNVLFIWAKRHPETSYRQGMHDLLGTLVFVLASGTKDASLIADTVFCDGGPAALRHVRTPFGRAIVLHDPEDDGADGEDEDADEPKGEGEGEGEGEGKGARIVRVAFEGWSLAQGARVVGYLRADALQPDDATEIAGGISQSAQAKARNAALAEVCDWEQGGEADARLAPRLGSIRRGTTREGLLAPRDTTP